MVDIPTPQHPALSRANAADFLILWRSLAIRTVAISSWIAAGLVACTPADTTPPTAGGNGAFLAHTDAVLFADVGGPADDGGQGDGGCKQDLDCVDGAPCVSATCDVKTGQCQSQPKPGCCEQGVCCDPATFAAKAAGSACGTTAIQVGWACDGASVRRRESVAGCDGASVMACSTDAKDQAWTPWTTTKTCTQGQLCVLSGTSAAPTCVVGPQCSGDSQCNDGKICTQDLCKQGKCVHPPGVAGTPCGATALATEYSCGQGGLILRRFAVSTCDGLASACPATSATPIWGAWQVMKTCGFNEVCKISDKSQPGTCTGAPKCKPGSTCCTPEGQYAAKATACGSQPVKTEAKCDGGKAGKLSTRSAMAGCSGGSTSCYTYVSSYLAWGPWQVDKQCGPLETCELNYSKTKGSCSKKTQCGANGTCCDKDGFYALKGSKCGSAAWKTELRCHDGSGGSSAKGAAIQERKGWRGCTGSGTYCSSVTANLVWDPWVTKKTCGATALCEVKWGSATCVTACSPSQTCCSAQGDLVAKGTKCGNSSIKTERKCGGAGKGGTILERKAFYGCSGSSASCSYATANHVWGAWQTKTTCAAWQGCAIKYGSPTCTSPCTPSQACCSKLGEFAVKGTACGTYTSTTETQCSGPELGGKIMIRKAVRGCSGGSASCSYGSADYVWSAWTVKATCKANQVCKGSYSQYCVTVQ